jgi:hypothetical protein
MTDKVTHNRITASITASTTLHATSWLHIFSLQVCQNEYTFYGSNGNIANITMTKGCARATDCAAVNDPVNGTCQYCAVAIPSCTTCCNTPFCNYDFQPMSLRKQMALSFSDEVASVRVFILLSIHFLDYIP